MAKYIISELLGGEISSDFPETSDESCLKYNDFTLQLCCFHPWIDILE